jgi:DNA-binding NarL/FixJ family response regulator
VAPIRILLADDHELVRAGLSALLKNISGIEVIAEAANGRETLRQIDERHPDVVLMDIMMPEMNGLEATARAVSMFPRTQILILSMNAGQEFVLEALQAGAAGYLLKNISPAELEQAIRAVARGEIYISPAIAKHVVDACLKNSAPISSLARLPPRQREVLQLIAEGNTTKTIAKKLGLSVKTIETYRAELMQTLAIHDIAGLTRYAIRTGLITPEA